MATDDFSTSTSRSNDRTSEPAYASSSLPLADEQVIPLVEEQLEVGKRVVETGTVRLHKHTEERTETVDVPLTRVTWQVEHVPVGRVVAEAPAIRYEGDTTIYPVVEEKLIVTREITLKEEVRVTRTASTTHEKSSYTLKREQITEDRGDQAQPSSTLRGTPTYKESLVQDDDLRPIDLNLRRK